MYPLSFPLYSAAGATYDYVPLFIMCLIRYTPGDRIERALEKATEGELFSVTAFYDELMPNPS